MGMNMVSKGVQNVLDYLQDDFPDMDVVSISGILTTSQIHRLKFYYSAFTG
jgi:hydroxymethylglutaryl-CoA reductase